MDAVGALSSTQRNSQGNSGRGMSELSSEDFTQLIITELTKQDPLQPNDTNALLNQIATIRSIESDTSLSTSLSSLVEQNDFSSAATIAPGAGLAQMSNASLLNALAQRGTQAA